MIFNDMFVQTDILGKAMQASAVRNDVISNNIANADVPGFKKKTVQFESHLSSAIKSSNKKSDINLDRLKPTIQTEYSGFSYRLDENNVDIETEMVDLYQNSIKYDTLASGVISNYKRINLVITGIK